MGSGRAGERARTGRWRARGAAVLLLLAVGAMPAQAQPPDSLAAAPAPAAAPVLDAPVLDAAALRLALRYGPVAAPRPFAPAPGDRSGDRWIAEDKAKHLVVSATWTLATQYVLVAKGGWGERDALPASLASGAAVGLAKELYDWRAGPTGHFSRKDLVADALGLALAAGLVLL